MNDQSAIHAINERGKLMAELFSDDLRVISEKFGSRVGRLLLTPVGGTLLFSAQKEVSEFFKLNSFFYVESNCD